MKVAILVALSDDQRTGQPVSTVLPQDEAVRLFKEAVTAGLAPAKDLPTLEVWTRTDGRSKTQRFDPARAAKSKASAPVPKKVKELTSALEAATQRIADLELRLAELSQPQQQEQQSPSGGEDLAEGDSPLVPK